MTFFSLPFNAAFDYGKIAENWITQNSHWFVGGLWHFMARWFRHRGMMSLLLDSPRHRLAITTITIIHLTRFTGLTPMAPRLTFTQPESSRRNRNQPRCQFKQARGRMANRKTEKAIKTGISERQQRPDRSFTPRSCWINSAVPKISRNWVRLRAVRALIGSHLPLVREWRRKWRWQTPKAIPTRMPSSMAAAKTTTYYPRKPINCSRPTQIFTRSRRAKRQSK